MPLPSGKAPVYLDQLLYALVTSPDGVRPKPVRDSSEEMTPVPVLVNCVDATGNEVAFPLAEWAIEKRAGVTRLLLTARLPENYALVQLERHDHQTPPAPALPFATIEEEQLSGPVPWTASRTDGIIPEIAHYDPEVTRANTSRPAGVTASGNGTGERVPNQGDQ
jgi:hypothetical protein